MSRPDLLWYLRRLRQMSPAEAAHRGVDAGRRLAWARRQVRPGAAPAPLTGVAVHRAFASPLPDAAGLAVPADAARAVIAAAEQVLAGTWPVLGVRRTDSADPDWFFDPMTGRHAPREQLAFRVHHRDEAETGNIKQIWEMSRHHHVTVLATAWWLTADERYAEAAAAQLRSWWSANPFLSGVHWTSGIEVGVRLVAWVWTRRLLADWPKVGDLFEHNDDAVRQIGWHQEFLAAFPSRGSSANNHVLAEAAGGLAAACAFPWYARSAEWRRSAAALLERELAANTHPDGVNREQASDYHRFVLELGLVAAVEADASGTGLSEATWAHLARMLDAAAALVDITGRPPRQGDGDEGRALLVDDPERDPWAAAVSSGAALIGPADWWPAVADGVQARLLGALGRTRRLPRPAERPGRFPGAGLVLLRSWPEDGPEIWCRCDGGPHGFGSIAAHAHADALSLEVRHDGVDILADPGTYCYHGEAVWRSWFRSTAAHNTIEIGGASQSVSGGPFLWNTQATTTTLSADIGEQPVQSWTAEHDGYRRRRPPVTHRRAVTLDSPARRLQVVDTLTITEPVAAVLRWQLGPDVQMMLDAGSAALTWPVGGERRRATLTLPRELSWSWHRGDADPIEGWYSPRFGLRIPATALVGRGTLAATTHLATTLEL